MLAYSVIDEKTQKKTCAFGNCKTTLQLVYPLKTDDVGIHYHVDYPGGHTSGMEVVKGNEDRDIYKKAPISVHLSITDFSRSKSHALMHVKITVKVVGKCIIFSKTLAGDLPAAAGWAPMLELIEAAQAEELQPVG